MKRWITWVLTSLVLCVGNPALADEPAPMSQNAEEPSAVRPMATKLTRGIANFTTGWVELPKQVYLVGKNEGWMTGAIRGPIDGFGMLLARTIAGAYEVLTFPLPLPPQYQPMLKPDYVWQPETPAEPAHRPDSTAPRNQPESRHP